MKNTKQNFNFLFLNLCIKIDGIHLTITQNQLPVQNYR